MALADTLEQINDFDISDVDFDKIGIWPPLAKAMVCVVAV